MKRATVFIRRYGITRSGGGCVRGYRAATYGDVLLRAVRSQCMFHPTGTEFSPGLLLKNPFTAACPATRRNFKASSRTQLELPDGKTQEEWEESFYKRLIEQKQSSIFRSAHNASAKTGYIIRTHYLVLVKDGKTFIPPDVRDDLLAFRNAFSSPDVISTSFMNIKQREHAVIQNRFHTIKEWEAITEQFVQTYPRSFVLYILMNFISLDSRNYKVDKNVDLDEHIVSPLLESFLDFLFTDQNHEFCQRSLVHYFRLCAYLKRYDLIEKAYGRAKNVAKIFGPVLMSEFLNHLGKTKYWKDTYQFFDVLKGWSKVPPSFYHNIASIALRHGDYETAFGLIGNAFNPEHREHIVPFMDGLITNMMEVLRYDEDPTVWQRNRSLVEYFFMSLAESNIFPKTKEAAQKIADWFTGMKDQKWEYAHVDSSDIPYRHCPFTGVKLKQKKLKDEEYNYLAKVVLKEVIQRESVLDRRTYNTFNTYESTHANELKSFLTMVYEKGPFDIVIDGMNLYYNVHRRSQSIGSVHPTGELASLWLRNLVLTREKKLERKLNILIVFKHHLYRATSTMFKDFATVWYLADDSEDDPYFLYGALLSGRRCRLLTLDQLRDLHFILRSKFDYKTVNLIFKWQQIHQDLVLLKRAKKMAPQYFDISIQRSTRTWHFPYYSDSPSPLPNKWLCLKRTDYGAEKTMSVRNRTGDFDANTLVI